MVPSGSIDWNIMNKMIAITTVINENTRLRKLVRLGWLVFETAFFDDEIFLFESFPSKSRFKNVTASFKYCAPSQNVVSAFFCAPAASFNALLSRFFFFFSSYNRRSVILKFRLFLTYSANLTLIQFNNAGQIINKDMKNHILDKL